MQVTVFYHDKNHGALGRSLEPGERLIFGRGERADLQVSGEEIAEVHFAIENDGQSVWVHRLVDAMSPVLLNDEPVEKSEVDDGDTVATGNAKIRVQIRGRDRRDSVKAPPLPQSAPERPVAELQPQIVDRQLPTGLTMYHDANGLAPVQSVVRQLADKYQPFLLANFKMAGEKPPAPIAANDLLAAAPDEVTASNSLHVIAAADLANGGAGAVALDDVVAQRDQLFDVYHRLRAQSAGVLAFTPSSKADVVKSIGFHRGFYCSADGLDMFLRQGSRELARALLSSFSAVLIARPQDTDWSLYVDPARVTTIQDLGIEAASPTT